MTRRTSESGFTLLEVLVASMLLAMLITILTMVFNSSSIAWTMGKAGVADMATVRNNLSAADRAADNAVPGVDLGNQQAWGLLVGPWKADGTPRRRAIEKMTADSAANKAWGRLTFDLKDVNAESGQGKWARDTNKRLWATFQPGSITVSSRSKAHIVGVWSYGPDGQSNTGDDISTWPDVD